MYFWPNTKPGPTNQSQKKQLLCLPIIINKQQERKEHKWKPTQISYLGDFKFRKEHMHIGSLFLQLTKNKNL